MAQENESSTGSTMDQDLNSSAELTDKIASMFLSSMSYTEEDIDSENFGNRRYQSFHNRDFEIDFSPVDDDDEENQEKTEIPNQNFEDDDIQFFHPASKQQLFFSNDNNSNSTDTFGEKTFGEHLYANLANFTAGCQQSFVTCEDDQSQDNSSNSNCFAVRFIYFCRLFSLFSAILVDEFHLESTFFDE